MSVDEIILYPCPYCKSEDVKVIISTKLFMEYIKLEDTQVLIKTDEYESEKREIENYSCNKCLAEWNDEESYD